MDSRKKHFGYDVMRSQIQLASKVMTPPSGRIMGSAASGGWENCHVLGVHTCFMTLQKC
jgi:hypothetical protein